ncbi:hypothetical protein ACIQFP_25125 [Nocardiopsis alba]|uniref:hypothetical protein n=1 Tax=Nocardiopsis alba TaxID=53437 RepID=UPI0037FDB449
MKTILETWTKLSTLTFPKERKKGDRGAGFVEYGAILVFVGIIAALLYNSNIGNLIVQGITSSVSEVFSTP